MKISQYSWEHLASPLAEGRELKFRRLVRNGVEVASPLAEGRELKYEDNRIPAFLVIVAPRGGA